MKTRIVRLEGGDEAGTVAEAAAVLRRGQLCAFPTETVYGLGADALNAEAVRAIYAAKGRPAENPLIVHVADVAGARRMVTDWPAAAEALAASFWPGPLAVVLPRASDVPDVTTAGLDTVAVRVPDHAFARSLIAAAGGAVAAPSANRSEAVSPTTAAHVKEELDGRVPLVVDGGPTPIGIESTVVSLLGPPRLLRPGDVSRAALETVVGPVAVGPASGRPVRSPGQMRRHYAPRATVLLARAADLPAHAGDRTGALVHSRGLVASSDGAMGFAAIQRLPADPRGYARGLYAALRMLDTEVERIVIEDVPADDPAWAAIADRLHRAGG
ncbi:MAG: L-threonylcarbamoyladenylate synthase [Myxococcota bacterium]